MPLPLGVYSQHDEVNFAVLSRDQPDPGLPGWNFVLGPVAHRTGDIWHFWTRGVPGDVAAPGGETVTADQARDGIHGDASVVRIARPWVTTVIIEEDPGE